MEENAAREDRVDPIAEPVVAYTFDGQRDEQSAAELLKI